MKAIIYFVVIIIVVLILKIFFEEIVRSIIKGVFRILVFSFKVILKILITPFLFIYKLFNSRRKKKERIEKWW